MALFKAVVRRPRKDGFWQVYICVCVDRRLGYIATDKYVTGKGLGRGNELTDPYVLQYCSGLIIEYNDRLNRKDTSRWTVRQVVEYLRTAGTDLCFSEYARLHIDRMIEPRAGAQCTQLPAGTPASGAFLRDDKGDV